MSSRRNAKKPNLSMRRRALIYYQRVTLVVKLALLALVFMFFFTHIFDNLKKTAKAYIYELSAGYGFILEKVIIEGQKNTSLKDIVDSLQADKGEPIFLVSLTEVKARLEENKWVKAAIVERKLPSTIYIAVIERTPIAIWQFERKLYLIDSEGNRIAAYEGQDFEGLIHVVGQDANIYAQNLLDELSKYPNLASKVKSAVRYGQRRWNLNFTDNFTVKMPEIDFSEAYKYLNSLDKNKKLFGQDYKTLDLRDANKYYFEKH
ncbi:MAG: cell division protein FtsQ/DivIB [Rickettsiaceae bacterium]